MSTGYTMYRSFTKWIHRNQIVEKLNIEVSQSMPIHFYPRQHIYILIGIKKKFAHTSRTHMNQLHSFFGSLAHIRLFKMNNQLLLRFETDQFSNLFWVLLIYFFFFVFFSSFFSLFFILFRPSFDSHTIN